MNMGTNHTVSALAAAVLLLSLAACGTARSPATGGSTGGDRLVAATQHTAAPANELAEIVVIASRLPAPVASPPNELAEIVVRADRLPANGDPATGEAQVAALLD